MTAFVASARRTANGAWLAAAAVAGKAMRSTPGIAGAALISYGAWTLTDWLGYVVAGAFLLAVDRRIP